MGTLGMPGNAFAALCGVVLLVGSGCGEAPPAGQGEEVDWDEALSVGTSGVIHAVLTIEPADGAGSTVQDIYIDADHDRSFSREYGPDGDLARMVVIDGGIYREYLAGSGELIEHTYESEGEGPLNELSETVFGYKEAIEEDKLTSVESVTVDGSPVVRISSEFSGEELGDAELVVDLDAKSLFPTKGVLRTLGSNSRDLVEISYEVDSVAAMPDLPEMPTAVPAGSESVSTLASDDLASFDEFPVYVPRSELLDGYTPEAVHHESATTEERSSVVSIYYWPPDVAERERTVADLQVSNVSAASVDATDLEASGETVTLPNGTDAVAVREGDALFTITWEISDTRISVIGNLEVFSEGKIREIAGNLTEATKS